ncbi:MAG: glycosyltransferase [Bacteroidota bacterium]
MFSVLIPTYHRNDLLRACLEHIVSASQNFEGDYEIIVSDDGKATTAQLLIATDFPEVQWAQGPQAGPAANRNHAARQAKYDWLVFLDDDCLPDAQLLTAYADAIQEDQQQQVFEGKIYAERERRGFHEEAPINLTGGKFLSCNICLSKSTFEKLDGFDESFPYATMEDTDLKVRILEAGHRIQFVERAAVCHPWRPTKGWNMYQKRFQSYRRFIEKYPEKKKMHNRVSRLKILISRFLEDFQELAKYRFRGMRFMFYQAALNVRLLLMKRP